MTSVVLLGSVFLPGFVLQPLAEVLSRNGYTVRVAAGPPAGDPAAVLAGYAAAVGQRADVVVAHSNAGHFVPALLTRGAASTAVFMDAVVPDPAGGRVPVVPVAMGAHLRSLAQDGRLPPWTAWWAPADVLPLFPSEASLAAVHAAAPRVPVSYVDGVVDVPAGWATGTAAAFLAFGDTYAAERRLAASLGWPVRTLPLGHLGVLQDPEAVAAALSDLLPRPSH